MNIRLTKDQKVRVTDSMSIYKIMQQIFLRERKIRRKREHLWVVGLNTINKILFIELVSLGADNRLKTSPPDVFRMGIHKLAVKLILVHNRKDGSLRITDSDREFTDRILKVGKILAVDVLDHLVIAESSYASFADKRIMEELAKSGLFEIMDVERKELEEWKLKEERRQGEKQGERRKARSVAKSLKASGMPDEEIKKHTQLPLSEIRKL